MRETIRRHGFSLLELLVVIAIIAVLFAVTMPTYSRAISKAKDTAANEAKRQGFIARMSDTVNVARDRSGRVLPNRELARLAYRQEINTGRHTAYITEMLCVVRNNDEFSAYWFTLINSEADWPLEYSPDGEYLIARDMSSRTFNLPVLHDLLEARQKYGTFPVTWDFLSTNMADMNSGIIGINVMYSDSHIDLLRYPSKYPATSMVATRSDYFMRAQNP